MNLVINCLVKWLGLEKDRCERVLWFHPDGSHCYTIDVTAERAWPGVQFREQLEKLVNSGQAAILAVDPLIQQLRRDSSLTEKQSAARDHAWKVIQPLVEDPNRLVFDRRYSGKLIKEAAGRQDEKDGRHPVHVTSVYKYLRRYWQRGQLKEALQPDTHRCGGGLGATHESAIKKGKKGKRGVIFVVTEAEKVKFRDIIDNYYNTSRQPTFEMAYQKLLEKHYSTGHQVCGTVKVPILFPVEQRPTITQFRYVYDKEYRRVQSLRLRVGRLKFMNDYKGVERGQSQKALGPGDIYQIDSTRADVHLVDRLNRVVGRPTVYLVVDAFSQLVAGLHVTFFNASYIAAAMAIWNAFQDKVEYCRSLGKNLPNGHWNTLGKDLPEGFWPSKGLPQHILADRGDLLFTMSDQLASKLGIHLITAPAYTPIAKPLVERHFRMRNDEVIRWLPGAIPDEDEKRGGQDYIKKARLTKEEFLDCLLTAIINYNISLRSKFDLSVPMLLDGVEPTPHQLWQWGLQRAHLRDMDPAWVRLALLPTTEGSIQPDGIHVNTLTYTCARARIEEWFTKAFTGKIKSDAVMPDKIECSYDPYCVDHIFLLRDGTTEVDECELVDSDKAIFTRFSWAEVESYREAEKDVKDAVKTDDYQKKAAANATLKQILGKAERRRQKLGTPDTKHAAAALAEQQEQEAAEQTAELEKAVKVTPVQQPLPLQPKADDDKVASRWRKMYENHAEAGKPGSSEQSDKPHPPAQPDTAAPGNSEQKNA